MATYIPAPTTMDPLGLAIGQGFASGIAEGIQRRRLTSDADAFMEYLRNMQMAQQYGGLAAGSALGGPMGSAIGGSAQPDMSSAVAMPQFKTPQVQQMFLQMLLGQVLSPVEKAQIGGIEAQAMRDRAAAMATLNPAPRGSPFRQAFQNDSGEWRAGLYDPNGNLVKDLGPAPPSMIGQQGPSVDAERAKRIQELRSTGPLTEQQQAELNALLVPGGVGTGPTRDDAAFYTSRGFTSEEANDILGIRYGVKPRAGATASPESDLNRMLNIYTKASFDPIWGQDIPDLAAVKSLAQRRINELTSQIRNGPNAKPIAQDDLIREILNLKVGNTRIIERVPTARLFHYYPVLTSQLPTLNPEELDGVLSAIESGMTEAEILRFFTGTGGVTAPAGVQ